MYDIMIFMILYHKCYGNALRNFLRFTERSVRYPYHTNLACVMYGLVCNNQQERCFAAVFFDFFLICGHFNKNVGVWCVL